MLPKSIIDLISILGETEALLFVQRYGGTSVHIPRYKVKEHPFDKLSKHYGGTCLFVPKCTRMMLDQRNLKIKLKRLEGSTLAELSREFNVSDRHLQRIINGDTQSSTLYI